MGLCSGPKPPDVNPGLLATAQANERIAQEQIELGREQFEWSKQNAASDRQMLMPIFQQQQRLADSAEARSQEQYDYWKQSYQPLEQKIINEALQFNTDAEREKMAGQAGADIEQAFGQQRAATARELSRYGINPNSSTALRAAGTLGDEEALAKAGAMNQSRLQSRAMGMAMAADAANMGRGLSGQSNSAAALALQAGQAGTQNIMGQTQNAVSARGLGNANFGMGIEANSAAGKGYGQEFGARMQNWSAGEEQRGKTLSSIGSIAGMAAAFMADGGEAGEEGAKAGSVGDLPSVARARKAGLVRGPGGPVDDQIEARLSNGEYVIPADVVRRKGEEFFDKLVKKHHQPADQQRARGL